MSDGSAAVEFDTQTAPAIARAASVIGREHVRLGRNNQDGVAIVEVGEAVAVCVTDGCSSEPQSEVGAQLAARFLAGKVASLAATEPLDTKLATAATSALTGWLYRLVQDLDASPLEFAPLLERHFLFTFLCAVMVRGRALVFGIGDGAVFIDGRVTRLDAGPHNAPEYCAYRLLSRTRPERSVHYLGDASRVAVSTDGLDPWLEREPAGLAELFGDPVVWRNPAQLQRKLNVLAAAQRFSDDATVALLSSSLAGGQA